MFVIGTKQDLRMVDGDTGQTTTLYQDISQVQSQMTGCLIDKSYKHFITADIYGKIEAYALVNGKKTLQLC